MGNVGSNSSNGRRRHAGSGSRHGDQNHPAPPPPEINGNQLVFAAATPYPNPNPYQYPTGPYYPPPLPLPVDPAGQAWVGGRYPCGPVMQTPTPYVDHQKAVTIRNDVNLKKAAIPKTCKLSDVEFVEELIKQAGVVAVPGCGFFHTKHDYHNRFIRFAFCKDDATLTSAAHKMQQLVDASGRLRFL